MSFTFSNNQEVDYAALGMCPVCAVRFTHGCKHSNTIEAQEWLAAYAAAETSRDNTDYCIAVMNETAPHPVNEAQDIERGIDSATERIEDLLSGNHNRVVKYVTKEKMTPKPYSSYKRFRSEPLSAEELENMTGGDV